MVWLSDVVRLGEGEVMLCFFTGTVRWANTIATE